MSAALSSMFRRLEELRVKQAQEDIERHGLSASIEGRPLWRLFHRFYLSRHPGTVILCCVLTCLPGLVMYGYAIAGQFIADDILQIGLTEAQYTQPFDPTLLTEHQHFRLDSPPIRQGLDTSIRQRQALSTPERMTLLGYLAAALILMEVIRHGLSIIVVERTITLTQIVTFRLRQQLHDKLHALSMPYHDSHSPGRLMTHLFSDMSVIQNQVTNILRNVPSSIVAIIVGLYLVMRQDLMLGLLVACAIPTYAISYQWFARYLVALNRSLREREGELNSHIANRIGFFQVVKAYTRETWEVLSFLRRGKPILIENLNAALFNTGFAVVCSIITGTFMTVVLWLGALRCRDGLWTTGELLLFYGATGYLFSPVSVLAGQATMMHRLRAVAAKVMRVLDQPVELDDPALPIEPPASACEIQFDHVSLRYANAAGEALSDVSFTLPAGQRLCVMGPSGSGKSSLAKLACRLYDPTTGAVRYNGLDIRKFRISDLRHLVGFVNQEPIVFSGTIGENIRYGAEHAKPRAVVAAAQYAQIHDFIERLPYQYHSLTHERGLTLSGGQKQRVNLARALLQDPQVLILDDCTSALDADTEAKLIQSLQAALKNRTALLVSHRVSIAQACDFVLMLDHGKVAQFGKPRELLHTPGPFRDLCQQQIDKAKHAEDRQRDTAGIEL
ncbi:MAG: ABC transporter ATP-binding protein [Phycisphaeraceae bacterium]|nr:ABC transporter ATP-binding protein [Phycisphaeraceae bacterium]